MKGFSRWQRADRLERRLREDRPVAPRELLDEVVRRLEGSRPVPSTHVTFRRLGLAGGAAVTMLAVFAAFGGVGFAASGASDAASSTVDAILAIAKPAKVKPAKVKSRSVRAKLKPVQAKLGQSPQPVTTGGVSASVATFSSTSQSAAVEEYTPPRTTICHNGNTLTLPIATATSHLLNHPGDFLGPCP